MIKIKFAGDIVGKNSIKILDNNLELEMLSQGNTAEVYLYGDTVILKLFRENMPFEPIENEYKTAEAISSKLHNVPKVFGMVSYKRRYGIIYERIDGDDMVKVMVKKIHKIKSYSKSLASLHYELHKTDVDIPCDVKQRLFTNINAVSELSELEKEKIKLYLNSLPDGNSLCHFDYHPGNVMIKDNSFYVIDWMTACIGSSNADVARTSLLLKFGELQHVNPFIKVGVHVFERYVGNTYYKEYKRIAGISDDDIEQWILPVAAARLVEWITANEKRKLLKLVRKKLSLVKMNKGKADYFNK